MITKIRNLFMLTMVAAVLIGGFGAYKTMTTDKRPKRGAIVTVSLPAGGNLLPGREMRVTVRVGGRWEVRNKLMQTSPWSRKVQVPEGDSVHVEAMEHQERWAFLIITCTIHNDMGHLLDDNQGFGQVTCETLV